MRRNLTAKLIENLKPAADRRYEVRDALLPGFGIRVSVSGGKSWFVVARVDGQQVRHTLGTYPIVTLSEAREAARLVLKDIQLGIYAPSKPPPKPDLPTLGQTIDQRDLLVALGRVDGSDRAAVEIAGGGKVDAFQTAFVDDAGKLEFRKDIYGRDATMTSMLKAPHSRDIGRHLCRSRLAVATGRRRIGA